MSATIAPSDERLAGTSASRALEQTALARPGRRRRTAHLGRARHRPPVRRLRDDYLRPWWCRRRRRSGPPPRCHPARRDAARPRRVRGRATPAPARPSGPILFLTARDAPADAIKGLTLGGDDYIRKPFSLEEVIARVRSALRRGAALDDRATLRFADVELDLDAHEVRRSG